MALYYLKDLGSKSGAEKLRNPKHGATVGLQTIRAIPFKILMEGGMKHFANFLPRPTLQHFIFVPNPLALQHFYFWFPFRPLH